MTIRIHHIHQLDFLPFNFHCHGIRGIGLGGHGFRPTRADIPRFDARGGLVRHRGLVVVSQITAGSLWLPLDPSVIDHTGRWHGEEILLLLLFGIVGWVIGLVKVIHHERSVLHDRIHSFGGHEGDHVVTVIVQVHTRDRSHCTCSAVTVAVLVGIRGWELTRIGTFSLKGSPRIANLTAVHDARRLGTVLFRVQSTARNGSFILKGNGASPRCYTFR